MSKFILSDIFIGEYSLSQKWGSNPQTYAQFGQAGHNGWDFIMPNGTMVVSPLDGVCLGSYEQRDSSGGFSGFGRYCKILHESGGEYFVTVFAHLQSVEVSKGQKVKKFQLIAKSDNNGFSSAPHLHFGVYLSDAQGNKIETNDFGGYHNPGDKVLFEWKTENPTKPYEPSLAETMGITEDAKRALDVLENFKTKNNHGNLEGAINALLGSYNDLQHLREDKVNVDKQLAKVQEDLRDKITYITGQEEIIKTTQKQQLELADVLQVSNDFSIIKGEIVKLVAVEDENIVLRIQLKKLKDNEGNEVGKAIIEYDKKIKGLEETIALLTEENTQLKAKRIIDRFSDGEKIWLGIVTFFKKIKGLPSGVLKFIFKKFFKRGG